MRPILILLLCLFSLASFSQNQTEQQRMAKLKATMTYPVIKGSEKSGVYPVKDFTETTDINMEYKLLFDLTDFNPDSVNTESNIGLNEIAHKINLHVAAGIPLKNIHIVIIVHGPALKAITNNEYYQAHFKMDNPSIKLVNDLAAAGAKFIACGQAMANQGIERANLLPVIGVAFTAQTSLSYYQMKGYIKFDAKR
jgi:intracellular sulfur oxidation DsrE/DsrF family protein